MFHGWGRKMVSFRVHSLSLCLFTEKLKPLMLRDINEQCLLILVSVCVYLLGAFFSLSLFTEVRSLIEPGAH